MEDTGQQTDYESTKSRDVTNSKVGFGTPPESENTVRYRWFIPVSRPGTYEIKSSNLISSSPVTIGWYVSNLMRRSLTGLKRLGFNFNNGDRIEEFWNNSDCCGTSTASFGFQKWIKTLIKLVVSPKVATHFICNFLHLIWDPILVEDVVPLEMDERSWFWIVLSTPDEKDDKNHFFSSLDISTCFTIFATDWFPPFLFTRWRSLRWVFCLLIYFYRLTSD